MIPVLSQMIEVYRPCELCINAKICSDNIEDKKICFHDCKEDFMFNFELLEAIEDAPEDERTCPICLSRLMFAGLDWVCMSCKWRGWKKRMV